MRDRTLAWDGCLNVRDRARVSRTPAHAMLGVLESLERDHGSVAGFLTAHGLDEQIVGRAAARFR